ncbi:MAG: phosphatase PAP2 family protein [Clostridiales Family XIII bacterium]|jgi:undecaprenyl-diphosphatase|nr:phosphatase PAP2 family protein [Clostridiales Family XIII bacterium]
MEYYKHETESNAKYAVLIVLAGLFVFDLWSVISGLSRGFDVGLMEFVYGVRDEFLNVIMGFITRAGDTITITIICVVLVVLPTRVRFGIPAAGAAVVAGLVQYALRHLIDRARPDEAMWLILPEDGFSFPSGHANASFVFYLFLMVLLRRFFIINKSYGAANLVSVALPLLVAVVGVSRLYLGVHYATDVIGGWLLGAVLLIALVALYDNFYPPRNRISFDAPSWEYARRRRPWRKPQVSNPSEELIEFPKHRGKWKRPGTTAKRRALEEDANSEPPNSTPPIRR